ncbi:hypothetical protein [Frankia sp. KB5]|uniref:hypothetical protein n=1 Tax=Frankia sp. KB5 TaxID=683318 RepID=UPI001F52B9EE|nr:hypothetical protein [Frankia sp. KB5]
MSDITASDRRTHERSTNVPWFGFLAVGAAFALFALAIPQFDLTTVWSIAVLLGIVLLLLLTCDVERQLTARSLYR